VTTKRRRARRGTKTIAVAYLRVSTDEQALGSDAQRAAILAFAAREGITVASWHEDIGIGGATTIAACPGLLASVGALRTSTAGVLLVAKRDRLARDVEKAALVERLVEREGAKVVSTAGEGGDDPAGQLLRRIVDSFAEYERLIIKARTKSALAVKKNKGERVSRHAPYGHRFEGGRVVPDHAEQAIIARARELRAQRLTIAAIVDALETEGLSNRAGRRFGMAALHRLVA
jgi:DNA invertase Pin-like site-specific DNA recombinase